MKRVLLAFQFLTIVPVTDIKDVSEKDIGSASAYFPLAGALQGLIFSVSAVVFIYFFSGELANGLVLLVMVLIYGGLHIDGLSDTFDAIASTGNRENKLAIMKDSTTGPIGVTAIVIVLLLKYLLLNELFNSATAAIYYFTIFLMPVFSRWAMVPAIYHGRPASPNGLGKLFIEHTGIKELLIATLVTLLISFSAFSLIPGSFSSISYFLFILPALYLFSLTALWLFNRCFGGATGDNIGAVSEISDLLFLMAAVICIKNFI